MRNVNIKCQLFIIQYVQSTYSIINTHYTLYITLIIHTNYNEL